jgi:hypothetical protein
MPYIYSDAEKLASKPPVGTKQCVALIKEYTSAPQTVMWKEGKPVKGNLLLAKGTAIATFVDGKYPNHASGNHAAFYISQDAVGIWVVDQWSASKTIQKRRLTFKGQDKNGKFLSPSNNGDAFSVIE